MTTLAAARTALVTAVGGDDDYVAPPGVFVYSSGSDVRGIGRGQVEWLFRCTAYVGIGQADSAAASVALAAHVVSLLATLRATGYAVVSVGPDVLRTIAGGDHLCADITVGIMVTI